MGEYVEDEVHALFAILLSIVELAEVAIVADELITVGQILVKEMEELR